MKAHEVYRQIREKAEEVKEAIHAILSIRGDKSRWTADDLIDLLSRDSGLLVEGVPPAAGARSGGTTASPVAVNDPRPTPCSRRALDSATSSGLCPQNMSAATVTRLHKKKRPQVAQPTVESDSVWRRSEFDRGYKAGYEGSGYSPTSLPYIEGYESGELAAMRAGKRRI